MIFEDCGHPWYYRRDTPTIQLPPLTAPGVTPIPATTLRNKPSVTDSAQPVTTSRPSSKSPIPEPLAEPDLGERIHLLLQADELE
ncbi:MAG: hypothetical protein LC799_31895 [Actinobacteria bacterium]|nr:hypothetical protein [Actinomycetota bacterium]